MAAVKQDGYAFRHVSKELKNNKRVVMAAVKQNGFALEFASEELKNNKAVVLAAVKTNGSALRYASEQLKNNKAVVLAAVKENDLALRYASGELRSVIKIENGEPIIIKKKPNRVNRVIQKANKILESDDKLYQQAKNKNLTSSVHMSLMSNPVTLRTRNTQNRQVNETHFYDKEQIVDWLKLKSTSPITRNKIQSVVENKEKKKKS